MLRRAERVAGRLYADRAMWGAIVLLVALATALVVGGAYLLRAVL